MNARLLNIYYVTFNNVIRALFFINKYAIVFI